jgi:hypothetical protein
MSTSRKRLSTFEWAEIARQLRSEFTDKRNALGPVTADVRSEHERALEKASVDISTLFMDDLNALGLTSIKIHQATLDVQRGYYLRIVFGLADGSIAHCPHITLLTPVPAIAPVYRDRVDCLACFRSVAFPPLPETETNTCDFCQIHFLEQKMSTLVHNFGPLMLLFKICSECGEESRT